MQCGRASLIALCVLSVGRLGVSNWVGNSDVGRARLGERRARFLVEYPQEGPSAGVVCTMTRRASQVVRGWCVGGMGQPWRQVSCTVVHGRTKRSDSFPSGICIFLHSSSRRLLAVSSICKELLWHSPARNVRRVIKRHLAAT